MLGIFALSAALKETDLDKFELSLKLLDETGLKYLKASNLGFKKEIFANAGYFSCGSVDERLNGLKALNTKILLSMKGGYGSQQCLEQLDLSFFDGKSVFGYSDLTALFLKLQNMKSVLLYHSPMLVEIASLSEEELNSFMYFLNKGQVTKKSLYQNTLGLEALLKDSSSIFLDKNSFVWGGNLTLLLSMNTFPEIKQGYKNILFIEDCYEEAYKTERMIYALENSGYFESLDELWIGEAKDTLFNIELLEYFSSKYHFNLVKNLPFGHSKKFTLPIYHYYD